MLFKVHTPETASEPSKDLLNKVKGKYGFIPNLVGVFAESPEVLKAYLTLETLISDSTLTPLERNIALICISVCNTCDYCVAAHTSISTMQNLPEDVIQSVRENRSISDPKLEAFRQFVRAVTDNRGRVSNDEIAAVRRAGYTNRNILEVLLILCMKTLSNYTSHIAETPLDLAFQPAKWEKAAA